jgi:hypothetical protein
MKTLQVYFSHRISGGLEDPLEAFAANCAIAKRIGVYLNANFPTVEFYIPGGPSEEFVGRTYTKGYLTVDQIMEIDCEILATKDLVMCHVPEGEENQGGRLIECDYAKSIGKTVIIFTDENDAITKLAHYMTSHN